MGLLKLWNTTTKSLHCLEENISNCSLLNRNSKIKYFHPFYPLSFHTIPGQKIMRQEKENKLNGRESAKFFQDKSWLFTIDQNKFPNTLTRRERKANWLKLRFSVIKTVMHLSILSLP
jgi:hypothetical protein